MRRFQCLLFALGAVWLCAGANADPALWRLDRADGAKLYLFGTVHALKERNSWDTSDILSVMEEVDAVYVELNLTDPNVLQTLQSSIAEQGFAPNALADGLDEELLADVRALAAKLGVPSAQIENMRPWMAALTLTNALTVQAGFNPALGVDGVIMNKAFASKLPIESLDTPAIQIRAIGGASPETQAIMLEDLIDQVDELERELLELRDAWVAGDIDGLEDNLAEGFQDIPSDFRQFLLDDRDARWVSALDAVAADGPYLVAVGAAHVVLEGGLLDRFGDRGWTVTRIDDLH